MRKQFLFTIILVCLLSLGTSSVYACSCGLPASPRDSLEEATAVFSGKVINIELPEGIFLSSADPLKITFEVSRIWKGPDYENIVITTPLESASCGSSFEENKEYLVYAYGEESTLESNLCSRTQGLVYAQEDLEELGEGIIPTNSGSNYVPPNPNLILFASFVVVGVILSVLIVFLIRIFRK